MGNLEVQMPDFVSEKDLDEHKKERQKQWELVRKPNDPLERPEQIKPSQPVWKQLQDNREERKMLDEEARMFKNNVWLGYDADESDYYKSVAEMDHKKMAFQDKAVQDLLKQGAKARVDSLKKDLEGVKDGNKLLEKKFDTGPSKQKRKLASIVKIKNPVKPKKPALLEYSS